MLVWDEITSFFPRMVVISNRGHEKVAHHLILLGSMAQGKARINGISYPPSSGSSIIHRTPRSVILICRGNSRTVIKAWRPI
jgi:hypothetical protein